MIKKLSTLIVEDSEADAELIVRELQDGGFDPLYERVDTQPGMVAALERRDWDIIISDYSMPQFGGDAEVQIRAIRDHILTFRGGPSPKTSGAKLANNNNN